MNGEGGEGRVPGMGPNSPVCAQLHGFNSSVPREATKHNIIGSVVGEQALHFLSFFFSYLENQSTTREKIAHLQHIQFLIEQQPIQRRELITKLTRHLVR